MASRDSSLPGMRHAPRNMGTLYVQSCLSGVILMTGQLLQLQVLTVHWHLVAEMMVRRLLPLLMVLKLCVVLTAPTSSLMPMYGLLVRYTCLILTGLMVKLTWNVRCRLSLSVQVCELPSLLRLLEASINCECDYINQRLHTLKPMVLSSL